MGCVDYADDSLLSTDNDICNGSPKTSRWNKRSLNQTRKHFLQKVIIIYIDIWSDLENKWNKMLSLIVKKALIQKLNRQQRQQRQQKPSEFLLIKSVETQTKAQETLEFNLTQTRDSFSFGIPLKVNNGEGMLGLGSLELYISIFKETNKRNSRYINPSERKNDDFFRRMKKWWWNFWTRRF